MIVFDREKVIRLLPEIAEYFRECRSNASFASKAENHFWELQNAASDAVELLKEQPEIVRCKDCIFGAPTIINGVWLSVTCGDVDHRPEWFCADGERQ